VNSVENPEQNLNNRLDDEKGKDIIRNRHIVSDIVKYVSEAILFCGRQCVALRGDNEVLNGESSGKTSNFLAALQMIANHDDICMGQERLSFLALMHIQTRRLIHYQVKIDLDEVANWHVCHQTPTEAGARDNPEGLAPQYC